MFIFSDSVSLITGFLIEEPGIAPTIAGFWGYGCTSESVSIKCLMGGRLTLLFLIEEPTPSMSTLTIDEFIPKLFLILFVSRISLLLRALFSIKLFCSSWVFNLYLKRLSFQSLTLLSAGFILV